MFDHLSGKLQEAFAKLKKRENLPKPISKPPAEKSGWLCWKPTVNYRVVKDFVDKLSARALGDEVMKSLTPSQQYIKIVRDEMTAILSGQDNKLKLNTQGLTVILMAGIQGSGKTTTAAKLAQLLKNKIKKYCWQPATPTALQQ